MSEVESHAEKVRKNMEKWRQLGFEECHVWSKSDKIHNIYKILDSSIQQRVKLFIV